MWRARGALCSSISSTFIRATYERLRYRLSPEGACTLSPEDDLASAQIIVGVFGDVENPVVIRAQKDPCQPPLLPKEVASEEDERRRAMRMNSAVVLGQVTERVHYVPDEEDETLRHPPVQMLDRIDALNFIGMARRGWYWERRRESLFGRDAVIRCRVLPGVMTEIGIKRARVVLKKAIDVRCAYEFTSESRNKVMGDSLLQFCPLCAIPTQQRIQNANLPSSLSATGVFSAECGLNQYRQYAGALTSDYKVFAKEYERRCKGGEDGIFSQLSMHELEVVNSTWMLVVIDRWVTQGSQSCVEFAKGYVVLEHNLEERRSMITRRERSLTTRRPLIVQVRHRFFVHYFAVVSRAAAYHPSGEVIEPDLDSTTPYLIECDDVLSAFVVWCMIMRTMFKGKSESGFDLSPFIDEAIGPAPRESEQTEAAAAAAAASIAETETAPVVGTSSQRRPAVEFANDEDEEEEETIEA
jgi:hypothetical protein